jgi:hypothetical protein
MRARVRRGWSARYVPQPSRPKRLRLCAGIGAGGGSDALRQRRPSRSTHRRSSGGPNRDKPAANDKTVPAVAAPRRYRDREHPRPVAKQPCLICGRKPSDPHHLRYLQPRALGRRASDEFAVPLCRVHHRAVHRARDERAWWQVAGIDPIRFARELWNDTRIDEGRMEPERPPQLPPQMVSTPMS